MRNKAKKIFFCIIGLILVLVLMLGATVMMMFGTFITAAQSVRKLEDGLYCMEYHGDYGFDRFLEEGGADSDEAVADYLVQFLSHGFYKGNSQVQTGKYGCSTIVTEDDDGGYIFGRNYDWEKCRGMIVHTRPTDGYESFSTCCLDFLGFGDAYEPDGSLP